jgi:ERCC4-type nuclease
MNIIIDNREHGLYEKIKSSFTDENKHLFLLSSKVLPIGDIEIVQTTTSCAEVEDDTENICIIERKSLLDLLSSIKDGRYEEQSYRLIHSSNYHTHNIVYIIEGIMNTISPKDRQLIYSVITSLQLFKGFSVIRTSSMQETAEIIIAMTNKIQRDLNKGKHLAFSNTATLRSIPEININILENIPQIENEQHVLSENLPKNYCTVVKKVKKDNITPQNIGEILLSQIPGISSLTAIQIMKKFDSFYDLISQVRQNPTCLDSITIISETGKSRKINKTSIENLKKYIFGCET